MSHSKPALWLEATIKTLKQEVRLKWIKYMQILMFLHIPGCFLVIALYYKLPHLKYHEQGSPTVDSGSLPKSFLEELNLHHNQWKYFIPLY